MGAASEEPTRRCPRRAGLPRRQRGDRPRRRWLLDRHPPAVVACLSRWRRPARVRACGVRTGRTAALAEGLGQPFSPGILGIHGRTPCVYGETIAKIISPAIGGGSDRAGLTRGRQPGRFHLGRKRPPGWWLVGSVVER